MFCIEYSCDWVKQLLYCFFVYLLTFIALNTGIEAEDVYKDFSNDRNKSDNSDL